MFFLLVQRPISDSVKATIGTYPVILALSFTVEGWMLTFICYVILEPWPGRAYSIPLYWLLVLQTKAGCLPLFDMSYWNPARARIQHTFIVVSVRVYGYRNVYAVPLGGRWR